MRIVKNISSLFLGAVLTNGCQLENRVASLPHLSAPVILPEGGLGRDKKAELLLIFGSGPFYAATIQNGADGAPWLQLVLEVEVNAGGHSSTLRPSLGRALVEDRRLTGERVYQLQTDPMLIRELITPRHSPISSSVRGTLFRGRAKDGVVLAERVNLKIRRIIVASEPARKGVNSTIRYVVFGNRHELFAVPLASGMTSSDEILSLRANFGIRNEHEAALLRAGAQLYVIGKTAPAGSSLEAMVNLGQQLGSVHFSVLERISWR